MGRLTAIFVGALVVIVGVVIYYWQATPPSLPARPAGGPSLEGRSEESPNVEDMSVVAENLQIPWEVAFLSPTNDLLVTERPGRLLKIAGDKTVIPIQGVKHTGEGGLLGLAMHPAFEENQWIYLYLTSEQNGRTINRVERYRLEGSELFDRTVIVNAIPGSVFHDGGRIAFGPDDLLYITTGDAGQEALAQDKNSLAGKILRVKDDGSIPPDNPFGNAVYSYGHRNSQGLAWDSHGQLWATEHGRSGVLSGFDELNKIEKGKNYGWPVIQGDETRVGMERPIIHSGAQDTWAPAGMAFKDDPPSGEARPKGGSLFFGGLKGEALYEAKLQSDGSVMLKEHFKGEFGRIRAVAIGPDGFLYITTSNTDGRGNSRKGDDKIIRIRL